MKFAEECHKLETRIVKTKNQKMSTVLKHHVEDKKVNQETLKHLRSCPRQDTSAQNFREMIIEKNNMMIDILSKMMMMKV